MEFALAEHILLIVIIIIIIITYLLTYLNIDLVTASFIRTTRGVIRKPVLAGANVQVRC